MKNLNIFSLSLLALIPNFVFANENKISEIIIISATKTEKKQSQIGSSIDVLNAKKINEIQAISVVDALKTVSALSITSNGGYGQPTSVRIRGAEPEHTQVIYDGVRLADASSTAGGFDFADLMAADCEKIEILKGPQSSLYGSDAIGGVINIITKKRKNEGLNSNIQIEAGSLQTYLLKGGINAKYGALSANINAIGFQTNGISALAKENGGNEKDPYENYGIVGNFNYEINQNFNIDFRARYGKSKAQYDANYLPPNYELADSEHYNEIEAKQYYVALNNNAFENKLKQNISWRSYETNRQYFNTDDSPKINGDYIGKIEAFEYSVNFKASEIFNLIGGLSSEKSQYAFRNPASWNPNPAFEKANTTLNSAFVEGQLNPIKGLFATIGARFDNHEQYGDKSSFRATIAYSPNENNTVFRANYGEGFKAPSLYQLYSEYGNPLLNPEISNAFEIGINQRLFDNFNIDIAYFDRETENQIGWFSCWPQFKPFCLVRPYGYYENISKTETKGIDANINGKIGKFNFDFGVSKIDPRNISNNDFNFGKLQPRRAKLQSNFNISYKFNDKLNLAISHKFVGTSYENVSNSVKLKEYNLLGFNANYKINDNFETYIRVHNIGDEIYQTAYGYGTLPRTFNLGLKAKF